MRRMVASLRGKLISASLLAGLAMGSEALLRAQEINSSALPPGQGRDLLHSACTQCHGLKPILQMRDGAPGWRNFVQEMVLRGAQLAPEEAETIIQYLAENLGPRKPSTSTGDLPSQTAGPAAGGGEKTISLPPGAGRELVESRCAVCHDLARVITVKRSRDEWERVAKNMVERGTPATPQEIQTIVLYLSSQFGKPTE